MKHKKPLSYYLGTFLMVLAIGVLIYTYYPIAQIYLFPASPPPLVHSSSVPFAISIPKIRATSPIIAHVDPFNEEKYLAKLKQGVAHAKGFALPDQKGTTFLFAHSSDLPWNITRYNTAFFRLHELKKNDAIVIWYKGKKYTYTVRNVKTVWPQEINEVTESRSELILQTCTPIGTALQRLLVFADKTN